MSPPLSAAHRELLDAARAVITLRYRPGWHVVGAALRTPSGRIFTGVHLEANIGRIAVCAEAVALGRAASEAGETEIDTIVAVYHSGPDAPDPVPHIVAPCGMCREMIADYAPRALVIMPDAAGEGSPTPIGALIPGKFTRP